MQSKFRTNAQNERIKNALSVGYKWERDSDYSIRVGRGRTGKRGCISILTGNVIGSDRSMIVYPDGSVDTQAQKGNSSSVTFNQSKLLKALETHGLMPGEFADEDAHFGG